LVVDILKTRRMLAKLSENDLLNSAVMADEDKIKGVEILFALSTLAWVADCTDVLLHMLF
jgi:hypothetical protein